MTQYSAGNMILVSPLIIVAVISYVFWYYFMRNPLTIPLSAGAKFFFGHVHHFDNIKNSSDYEEIYIRLTDPKNGETANIRFFHTTIVTLNTVSVAENLLKSTSNINKSSDYNVYSR